MTYHITDIPRGKFGEISKIIEELREWHDALDQDVSIMALVELSDVIGAINGFYRGNIYDYVLECRKVDSMLDMFAEITDKTMVDEFHRVIHILETAKGAELMHWIAFTVEGIRMWLQKHHPSINMDDLRKMSVVTGRAFRSGTRVPR